MPVNLLLWICLGLLIAAALVAVAVPSARGALRVAVGGSLAAVVADSYLGVRVASDGPLAAASGWLRVDALSAFHLALLVLVDGLSSVFAAVYFGDEIEHGGLTTRQARLFGGLWCGALATMTLLLVSNNLGMMWVGMEATTLLTAFLISLHVSRESLEAMWKYLLICSVGVAFAFMGTLLTAAAAPRAGTPSALLWTGLVAVASRLDPMLMRAAFVFLLVGYGTKAGLAPMHNWLPDAHSQAPAPVSALFSGFMLNAPSTASCATCRSSTAPPEGSAARCCSGSAFCRCRRRRLHPVPARRQASARLLQRRAPGPRRDRRRPRRPGHRGRPRPLPQPLARQEPGLLERRPAGPGLRRQPRHRAHERGFPRLAALGRGLVASFVALTGAAPATSSSPSC